MEWDVFISHASEDTEAVARPLSLLLKSHGVKVWLDKDEIELGNSLFRKINEGLYKSRFSVVILSPAFIAKEWTKRELEALHELETETPNRILPIWHGVDHKTVVEYFPLTAGKVAVSTDQGMVEVASGILKVVMRFRASEIGFPLNNLFLEDIKLFEDLQMVFNRPAFKGPFLWQTDPIPFQKAYKIIVQALTTGVLQNRAGVVMKTIVPISKIKDAKLFSLMQEVVNSLKTTDNLILLLEKAQSPERYEIIKKIDDTRDGIISKMNKVWECFGINTLPIPTKIKESTDVWEDHG